MNPLASYINHVLLTVSIKPAIVVLAGDFMLAMNVPSRIH